MHSRPLSALGLPRKPRRSPPVGFLVPLLCVATGLVFPAGAARGEGGLLSLTDGDRVVLIGDTLIERDQAYGYLETRLTIRHPGARIAFRNLGWSGDTVFGDSRAGFDTALEGYQRLIAGVKTVSPTVMVLGYGGAQSSARGAGLEPFRAGLGKLLDDLAPLGARFVILGLLRHERKPPPLPDPTEDNHWRAQYNDLLRQIASERGIPFVDLWESVVPAETAGSSEQATLPAVPLTDNGIHLNDAGYRRFAEVVDEALSGPFPVARVEVALDRGEASAHGTRLARLQWQPLLEFELLDDHLPPPAPHAVRVVTVTGLSGATCELRSGDAFTCTATVSALAAGMALVGDPVDQQTEALRQLILKKNELYFHRWRPQNETYLFGFRKHEQGQNAIEVPKFDPLVAELEAQIAEHSRPRPVVYEVRSAEENQP